MSERPSLDAQLLASAWPRMSFHERNVWRVTHWRTLERQAGGFMEQIENVMSGTRGITMTEIDQSIAYVEARMKFLRQYAQACVDQRLAG